MPSIPDSSVTKKVRKTKTSSDALVNELLTGKAAPSRTDGAPQNRYSWTLILGIPLVLCFVSTTLSKHIHSLEKKKECFAILGWISIAHFAFYPMVWFYPGLFQSFCKRVLRINPVNLVAFFTVTHKVVLLYLFFYCGYIAKDVMSGDFTYIFYRDMMYNIAVKRQISSESIKFVVVSVFFVWGLWTHLTCFELGGKNGCSYGRRLGKRVPTITDFPYDTMQHPQYVSALAAFIGFVIIFCTSTNSRYEMKNGLYLYGNDVSDEAKSIVTRQFEETYSIILARNYGVQSPLTSTNRRPGHAKESTEKNADAPEGKTKKDSSKDTESKNEKETDEDERHIPITGSELRRLEANAGMFATTWTTLEVAARLFCRFWLWVFQHCILRKFTSDLLVIVAYQSFAYSINIVMEEIAQSPRPVDWDPVEVNPEGISEMGKADGSCGLQGLNFDLFAQAGLKNLGKRKDK